jgi:hypothetical protein
MVRVLHHLSTVISRVWSIGFTLHTQVGVGLNTLGSVLWDDGLQLRVVILTHFFSRHDILFKKHR